MRKLNNFQASQPRTSHSNTDGRPKAKAAALCRLGLVIVSIAGGVLFSGCRLGKPEYPSQDVAVTNSVRRWSQGISMSFPNPPTEGTAALLKLAKFKEKSQRVYVLERYDRHDALQNTALENALREGAVLVGTLP